MTKTAPFKTFLLLLSLLPLVACGEDEGVTDPGADQLTEQEVAEMMEALASAGAFTPPSPEGSGTSAPGAPARAPFSYDVETTSSCPGGGSVTLSGSVEGDVDQETGAGDFNVTMTQGYLDCVASSDAGTTFTFSGSPALETSMDFTTTADGGYAITGSHTGSLGWAESDRSGTCNVDISYDFSGSETSFTGSASGTVCGTDVSESLDVAAG